MKIVMVSTDYLPNIGGIAAHIYNLSKELVQLGHEVHVVNPRYNIELGNSKQDGIFEHRINIKANIRKIRYLKYSVIVSHYIKKNIGDFDILHQHDFITSSLACLLSVSKHPWVWTNHSSTFLMWAESKLKREIMRFFYKKVDAIICPSEELKLVSRKIFKRKRIYYIPNGVDIEKFRIENKAIIYKRKNDLGFQNADKIILCPRRWVPKNGVIYLVKAISLLKKQKLINDRIKFVFVGSDKISCFEEYTKEIMSIIERENLSENVSLLGNIPHDSMHIYNSIADIVIIPSLMEAVSLSALEAMACGKVVIGTNVGGFPQIIKNGETGILVPPANEKALANAIYKLLNNAELCNEIGKKARKLVQEKYSWKQVAIKTLDIYRTLLNKK